MKRGEFWWADLGEPRGSEPGDMRPVLIVSTNRFNDSAIATVIVASVTSNLKLEEAPGNFRVPARSSGLRKPSVVVVSQIATLDRSFMFERLSRLPDDLWTKLDQGISLVFGTR